MKPEKEFQSELGQLLQFAGAVAWAARMYSSYVPENAAEFELQASLTSARVPDVDLFYLTDAVCKIAEVGRAVALGDRLCISRACTTALAAFSSYLVDEPANPHAACRTFEVWSDVVRCEHARDALHAIQMKNWL